MSETYYNPWQAAKHISEDSEVIVTYESNRSDELQEKRGEVEHVLIDTREGKELRIDFRRDDDQVMMIGGDGELETAYSMHPHVGYIVTIEVTNPVEMDVPEPTNDPIETARNAIRREVTERGNIGPVEGVEVAMNAIKEKYGEVEWEDMDGDRFTETVQELVR